VNQATHDGGMMAEKLLKIKLVAQHKNNKRCGVPGNSGIPQMTSQMAGNTDNITLQNWAKRDSAENNHTVDTLQFIAILIDRLTVPLTNLFQKKR
jgi:hypothetical protein